MKILKKSVTLVAAGFAAFNLVNFAVGKVDLIPDNVPFLVNIDDFIA